MVHSSQTIMTDRLFGISKALYWCQKWDQHWHLFLIAHVPCMKLKHSIWSKVNTSMRPKILLQTQEVLVEVDHVFNLCRKVDERGLRTSMLFELQGEGTKFANWSGLIIHNSVEVSLQSCGCSGVDHTT